jgi:hypothetical protein
LIDELETFAKWQFWAAGFDKGAKVSRLDSLKQVEKSMGREPKELASRPRLRSELTPYWSLFVDLKNAAEGSIKYTDITAYSAVYGTLSIFEVDMIRTLDQLHARLSDD